MSVRNISLSLLALGVAAFSAVLLVRDSSSEEDVSTVAEKPKKPIRAVPKAERAKLRAKAAAKSPDEFTAEEKPVSGLYAHMGEEDRKFALAIQDALDAEDLPRLMDFLERARRSKNAEIRRLMVEALQWFDAKAMFALSQFLADEDEEVRQAAVNAWDQVLQNIEDEPTKAELIIASLQVVTDEDAADTIASQFHTIDQKLAVDSMIKLLYGMLSVSKAAREKIKETYRFITGEEYVSARVARQWLRENYVPPPEDDGKDE